MQPATRNQMSDGHDFVILSNMSAEKKAKLWKWAKTTPHESLSPNKQRMMDAYIATLSDDQQMQLAIHQSQMQNVAERQGMAIPQAVTSQQSQSQSQPEAMDYGEWMVTSHQLDCLPEKAAEESVRCAVSPRCALLTAD